MQIIKKITPFHYSGSWEVILPNSRYNNGMFALKPDYEQSKKRIDAFWERQLIDRPVAQFILAKPALEQQPLPISHHASPAARWMDAGYQAELALAALNNGLYPGDTLPVAWPNLGPEVFAAFYGCPLAFGDYGTSWTSPILKEWPEKAGSIRLDWQNCYLKKLLEMTDALLEIGRERFIVGMTDWHPGGDALAALRDPQNLALDLVEHPAAVKDMLSQLERDYFAVYDLFYAKLRQAGQPVTAWINLACDGKYYIPSNDFSAMISTAMFEEFFLPCIQRECRFLEHSIYHLDGPCAIRHLDLLLTQVPELDVLQFVPTVGDEAVVKWAPLYQRIQAAGKGVHFTCDIAEIGDVIELLKPEGLYLQIKGAPSLEAAEAALKKLERWCLMRPTPRP